MSSDQPPSALYMIGWIWGFQEWATGHVLDAAGGVDQAALREPAAIAGGQGDGSVWAALGHVVGAEEHWTNRWLGVPRSPLKDASSYPGLGALIDGWHSNNERRRRWLAGLTAADLAGELHYFRTNGEEQRTTLWHTLLHVANHSTHHRAEASAALTGEGSPPRGVDMIDWIRAGCPGA